MFRSWTGHEVIMEKLWKICGEAIRRSSMSSCEPHGRISEDHREVIWRLRKCHEEVVVRSWEGR